MAQRKYFGTDGVRGEVGQPPITPDFVLKLGYCAGKVLVGSDSPHPTVLIGKDTRVSGYMLEAALQAGFTAAGVNVRLTGPLPTPGIAYLTRALRLDAGVMISASHNPYSDNGIKFFAAGGRKLDDALEARIESLMDQPMETCASRELGRAKRIDTAADRYIEFCKATFPNDLDLRGLKIVVDCANGATYHIAPAVFHELGATVVATGAAPDGFNINDGCGATAPKHLQAAVLQHDADFGVALDGDGDRLMMVDAAGRLYDGDQLIYVIARARQQRGELVGGVVGTVALLARPRPAGPHLVPLDGTPLAGLLVEASQALEDGLLADAPLGALHELEHPDVPALVPAAQPQPEGGGRFPLAVAGMDGQQGAVTSLFGGDRKSVV